MSKPMCRRFVCVAVQIVLLTVLPRASATAQQLIANETVPESELTEIPSAEAQDKTLAILREVYAQKYRAAKTPADQIALAKDMLSLADSTEDGTETYVLLREATLLAVQAGDAETALAGVADVAMRYPVDVWQSRIRVVEQLEATARSAAQAKLLAETALQLCREADEQGEQSAAKRLIGVGKTASRRSRDGALQKLAAAFQERIDQTQVAYHEVTVALAMLEHQPQDPAANLTIGKYLSYYRGDWDQGLAHLALGGDDPLAKLAQAELSDPAATAEQLELADRWWAQAENEQGIAQRAIREHAGQLYRGLLPQLAGLSKIKAEMRTEMVDPDEMQSIIPAAASTRPAVARTRPAAAVARTRPASERLPSVWFGHVIHHTPTLVNHFASYANFVIDQGWEDHGEAVIQAAREKGLLVVLAFSGTDRTTGDAKILTLAQANRDVVAGICWNQPYYDQYQPKDVIEFASRVKMASPGLQVWVTFVEKPRGNYDSNPVPAEVDLLVINMYFVRKGADIQRKADDTLGGWIRKAAGRPVLVQWCNYDSDAGGLVGKMAPGTMQAVAVNANKYGLSGLILGHFGTHQGHFGIEADAALVAEIQAISANLKIRKAR